MGCGGSKGGNAGKFDCSEKDLEELPTVPSSTKVLDCSTNKLTSLPASIGSLKALIEIDASTNQLTTLPAEIASCEALEVRHLGENPECG